MSTDTNARGHGQWALSFLGTLPLLHAAVATLEAPFDVEVLSASSPGAARIQQTQLDLGEGPGWDALRRRTAVMVPDLAVAQQAWPVARDALLASGIQSVYAFPLTVGNLQVGVVSLFDSRPHPLDEPAVERAGALARSTAPAVLGQLLGRSNTSFDDDLSARRVVHQATGMVIAQLRITPPDALLTIRAHAFATGQTVADVAGGIVDRRIEFVP